MRTLIFGSATASVLATLCLTFAQDRVPAKSSDRAATQAKSAVPTEKGPLPSPKKGDVKAIDTIRSKSVPSAGGVAVTGDPNSSDEAAIRQTAETFAKAYDEADAKGVASHFTADAEYIDEEGNVFEGRDAIEQNLSTFFAENAGAQLEIAIESIRFVNPGLAVEDGTTTVMHPDGGWRAHSRYVAVHVKNDGQWLVATVREHAPKGQRQHREKIEQLEWLIGEWIDESDESIVTFNCRPVDDGNFLVRDFTITIAGHEVMSGSQRIGWDPLTGRLRAWTFDSEGGHFEGAWHRDDDSWKLSSTGVTADGKTASGTSIFTFVNPHTITWQAVDHESEGVRLPDSELYTLVRRGPPPESLDSEPKK